MLITRRIFCNHQLLHNFTTKKLRISSAISNTLPIRFVLRKPLMQHRVQAKRLNSRLPCHTRRNPVVVVHLDAAVNNIFSILLPCYLRYARLSALSASRDVSRHVSTCRYAPLRPLPCGTRAVYRVLSGFSLTNDSTFVPSNIFSDSSFGTIQWAG